MQIELELRNHCIQTAAKRAYEKMLSRYLSRNIDDHEAVILENQIEGLMFFLQKADFQYLRSTHRNDNRKLTTCDHRILTTPSHG